MGVAHLVEGEQASLQGLAHGGALRLEAGDGLLVGGDGLLQLLAVGGVARAQTFALGFEMCALAVQGGAFLAAQGTAGAQGVTTRLGGTHLLVHRRKLGIVNGLGGGQLLPQGRQAGTLGALRYLAVDGGDFGLAAAIDTVGVEQIDDGRHEIGMIVVAGQIAREGGKKPHLAVGIAHHEHAQHLAGGKVGGPVGARQRIAAHLARRSLGKRMHHVVERVAKAFRKCQLAHIALKAVQTIGWRSGDMVGLAHHATKLQIFRQTTQHPTPKRDFANIFPSIFEGRQ